MNAGLLLILRILFLAALYAFLGLSLWVIWKSISGRTSPTAQEPIPPLGLSSTIMESSSAQIFVTPKVTIGRSPDCDFVLQHEMVSARHGVFSYHHQQWWYEDLNSTNGSYLEDLRIEEPIVVKDGDVLFCGEVDVNISIKPIS
ncbi:MAG: FHA domain-containing protein [Chloroflexi bacterium]|jgi:pSer/pThr/pTyr-binding forkhead associated (FHA) protein|nr:FHA domain-containing protein [Anaerolineaceae bacterium]NLI45359.1 FHA domain-containing protein [Chloroflexota bacterium]HOE35732.1 FHA domain-containing protein [Anaerolineaceae bacterium]HOT25005.1 FHA domain-containing protein [Anaerolineaceae bacterium]HQH57657.1 FHA domain-containing protein [Anaerolineaceae bacterium]